MLLLHLIDKPMTMSTAVLTAGVMVGPVVLLCRSSQYPCDRIKGYFLLGGSPPSYPASHFQSVALAFDRYCFRQTAGHTWDPAKAFIFCIYGNMYLLNQLPNNNNNTVEHSHHNPPCNLLVILLFHNPNFPLSTQIPPTPRGPIPKVFDKPHNPRIPQYQ